MIAGRVLLSQKAFVAVTVGVPSFLLLAINLYMAGAFELGPESQGDGAGRMLSEEGEEGDEDADYFGPVLTQIGLAFVQVATARLTHSPAVSGIQPAHASCPGRGADVAGIRLGPEAPDGENAQYGHRHHGTQDQ